MATVFKGKDGQLYLDDPEGLAVAKAVAKHNCRSTLEGQAHRVAHFRERARLLNYDDHDVVIVLANVDTPLGQVLADKTMPGHDWQQFRDRGEIPFARGLIRREGMQEFLALADPEAADKLATSTGLAVVVVDYGVADVFGF